MSYVEIETGRYVKRWAFWNPATWSIPKLYWDAWSQEQRIHAICRQLEKVIKYADYLGVNVDDIAARLKAIEEGQLNDFIVAAIEAWFEENEPEIVTAIEALNNALPITEFNSENTVKDSIDSISGNINNVKNIIPASDFDDVNTVKKAIDDLNTYVDEEIDEVKDLIEEKETKTYRTNHYVYVAGSTGSDDNDGLTRSTPFKTLDRALQTTEDGYFDIRVTIMESGTYTVSAAEITSITLHLYQDNGLTVDVELPDTITFYQCHLNFGIWGENPTSILNFINNLIILDNCSTSFNRTKFNRAELYGGTVYMSSAHFNSLDTNMASAYFSGTCQCYNEADITPLDFSTSTVRLGGAINALYIPTSTKPFMAAYDSRVHSHGAFPNYNGTVRSMYYYAYKMESSILFINSTSLGQLSNKGQNAPLLQYQTAVVKSNYVEI